MASPARTAAFDILLRVEKESSYASELLHSHTYNRLTAADHGLATELVMGVLRWRSRLDARIAEISAQPLSKLDVEVLTALRLAAYQIGWLSRIPARAAINESVELVKQARKRSAAPFANAVLRKLAAADSPKHTSEPALSGSSAAEIAANSAHPAWLVERWGNAYGLELARRICEYDQSVPITAIRIRRPEAALQLENDGVALAPGALLASARRVLRGDITHSEAFRDGSLVIQDEASQLVALLVGAGTNILDCCAAPGGKTAVIADRNPGGHIAALELHPHRAQLLRKLLRAHDPDVGSQTSHIQVIAADARHLPFVKEFDRILVDVPCSGTGTLARNPEIKWRLTLGDLHDLQRRQVGILSSAMAQVAPGGCLIYSTCSLEKEENEDVIELALATEESFRIVDCQTELRRMHQQGELISPDPSSLTRGAFLRTIPGVQPCDGFFAAILERV